MNLPYSGSVITGFLLYQRRQRPLSFDAPVDRRWRPRPAPIEILSDDDENDKLPSYSITKVHQPGIIRNSTGEFLKVKHHKLVYRLFQ